MHRSNVSVDYQELCEGTPAPLTDQVLFDGMVWFVELAIVNICLQRASRSDRCQLLVRPCGVASYNQIGIVDNPGIPLRCYVVSIAGQSLILPLLWFLAWISRSSHTPWWYGAQQQWAVGEIMAYMIGFCVQDVVVHWNMLDRSWLAHRMTNVVAAAVGVYARSWQGLLTTFGFVYEFGSLAASLGEVGVLRDTMCVLAMIICTFIPMSWVFHGLVWSPPQDTAACFVVFVVSFLAAARLWQCMVQITVHTDSNSGTDVVTRPGTCCSQAPDTQWHAEEQKKECAS